ncbi:hypothetical protein CPC08DRAFT_332809 [Agrocybe pediades]|nr:hypothetical protein CPC08DRAFT_332809 [Agrocybe pediades]
MHVSPISRNHVLSRRRRPPLSLKNQKYQYISHAISLHPFSVLSVSTFLGWDFVVFSSIFNPRVHPSPCTCFHCIFVFAFSSPRRLFTFLRIACFAPYLRSRRPHFSLCFLVLFFI